MNNLNLMGIIRILNKFSFVTGALGYAINKTKRKMIVEAQIFEEERMKLFEKYGENDGEGNYSVDPNTDYFPEYYKELTSIGEEMVEIDFKQVTKEEFEATDIYNENCSVEDYDILEALFVQPHLNDDSEEVR